MAELGRIQKPGVDQFSGKRKLYCVASVYPVEDAPDDYKDLVNKYWDEVGRQIEKIETAGRAGKIFCELMSDQSAEDFDLLKRVNERAHQLVKQRLEQGDTLVPLESKEITGPYTDWANCLRVVFTHEVFAKVLEFFMEYSEKRFQQMIKRIDENLPEGEAGLLIMKDEDRTTLQFPGDVEVFLITPPSYDDVVRWLRENLGKKKTK